MPDSFALAADVLADHQVRRGYCARMGNAQRKAGGDKSGDGEVHADHVRTSFAVKGMNAGTPEIAADGFAGAATDRCGASRELEAHGR